MAYLYEIQARECRDPDGRSEFDDVPPRIYVEAPDLKTFNAVRQIGEAAPMSPSATGAKIGRANELPRSKRVDLMGLQKFRRPVH
jgi:hypothetical protein